SFWPVCAEASGSASAAPAQIAEKHHRYLQFQEKTVVRRGREFGGFSGLKNPRRRAFVCNPRWAGVVAPLPGVLLRTRKRRALGVPGGLCAGGAPVPDRSSTTFSYLQSGDRNASPRKSVPHRRLLRRG